MREGWKRRDGGLQGQTKPRISKVLTRDYPVCCVALEVYTVATESFRSTRTRALTSFVKVSL